MALENDSGRRDEKEFDTEEEARAAIERMVEFARRQPCITNIKTEEVR